MITRPCENLDKEHINLLLHTEIWWLGRGTFINTLFELKDELNEYFQVTNKQGFAKCFEDEHWMLRLIYLVDNFHHMYRLKKSLKGPKEHQLTSSDKILAIRRKVNLLKTYCKKKILRFFCYFWGFKMKRDIKEHHILLNPICMNCILKLKIIFLPFQHICMVGCGTHSLNLLVALRIWL